MSTDPLQDIREAVADLTRPRTNEEPYTKIDPHGTLVRSRHKTHVPPLLEQLQEALEPGGTGDHGRAIPGSRAAARVDAMDTYMRIDQATYTWCKTYAESHRWDSITDRLRALADAAPRIEEPERHDLAREMRRWVVSAKVTTGWEVPPRRPNNSCPLCARKDTLRVRVGDGVTSNEASAVCTGCGETWDDSNIGLLAEHIRAENGDESLYAS